MGIFRGFGPRFEHIWAYFGDSEPLFGPYWAYLGGFELGFGPFWPIFRGPSLDLDRTWTKYVGVRDRSGLIRAELVSIMHFNFQVQVTNSE